MTTKQLPLTLSRHRRKKPTPKPDTRPRCAGCGTTWIEPALRRVNRRKTGYDNSAWCAFCHRALAGDEMGIGPGAILMTPRVQP